MARKRTELDIRAANDEVWDDGPGSLGIALPRGAEMGLRLYRLVEDGAVMGHTLEVDLWKTGVKIYIRHDFDGECRVIEERNGIRRKLDSRE